MKTRILKSLVTLAAAVLATGCGSEQATLTCRTAAGSAYATRYTLLSNPNNCPVVAGERIAAASYSTERVHPLLALGPELAVSSDTRGTGTVNDDVITSTGERYAMGEFSDSQADAQDICAVPTLSPVRTTLGSAANLGSQANASKVYTFRDVEFYTSPSNQATQVKGAVSIEVNGCSADYRLIGVWPAIPCTEHAGCGEGSGVDPALFDEDPAKSAITCMAIPGLTTSAASQGRKLCVLKGDDFVKVGTDI